MTSWLIGAIPSPGSNSIDVGGLTFNAYGVAIAIGVIAAVWLAGRRLAERGRKPEEATTVAMVAVPAGLIGARLYHVITDWQTFNDNGWGDAFRIWEGGLGIPGAIIGGAIGALIVIYRKGYPVRVYLDAIAPALPLAQAIGRVGNWFNQELFGSPTDLPWAVEIDPEHRPPGYAEDETFHPTFLYESLWNLALVGFLIWLDRKRVLKPGRLFAVYTGGYAIGRLWIELLRIDPSSELAGVRVNIWVMLVILLVSAYFVATGIERQPEPPADEADEDSDESPEIAPA